MKEKYLYVVGDNLYVNLTNRCSNRCEFCVRYYDKPVYGDLWITREPTAEEVKAEAIARYDLDAYREIVFCGYGEPTCRMDALTELGEFFHAKGKKTRVNTNGQGNLINGRDIAAELCAACDIVNISLNATDGDKYDALCHSDYGKRAFDALVDFARACVERGADVVMSVVDCIGADEIAKARQIAASVGARLRVRKLI